MGQTGRYIFKSKFRTKNKFTSNGKGWRSEDRRYKGNCNEPARRRRYARKFAPRSHAESAVLALSGERARRRSTACGITAITWSISSAVVVRPRLKRRLQRASSGERPMAISTCDGPTAPDEHAAPVEHAIPCRSSAMTSASPPAAGNEMFEVLDTRCARFPFT